MKDSKDMTRYSVYKPSEYETEFNFTYECEEDLFKAGFIIGSVFGSDGGILNVDKDEKMATITIPCVNQDLIQALYDHYEDDIRIKFLAKTCIIAVDKQLSSMGL